MGDIIASERATSVEELHQIFNRAIREHNATYAGQLVSPLTITLGDEFQGLTTSLAAGAAIVRSLRLQLLSRKVECRFVIGQAEVRTPLNRDNAWNMMGPGLADARAKLGQKRKHSAYAFSLPAHGLMQTILDAIGAGLTVIERGWTDHQRSFVTMALGGKSSAKIALEQHVTNRSVYKVLAAADMEAWKMQWSAIDAALAALDAESQP